MSQPDPDSRVRAPAFALAGAAAFSILILCVALAFSLWLLASGTAAMLPDSPAVSRETTIAIRIGWELLMLPLHGVILFGAVRMSQRRNYALARVACVVAAIPCCGPCLVLGIPIGIWGLVVLARPEVRASFRD